MKSCVLYAVSETEFYQQQLGFSLQSLRYYSPEIQVVVCVFGKVYPCLDFFEADRRIKILRCPSVSPKMGTSLKWFSLKHVEDYERVLFVDADTLFLGPVEEIFLKHRKADLYGDFERGALGDWQRGSVVIPMRIKTNVMNKLKKQHALHSTPVLFTGLLMFNGAFHREVAKLEDYYKEVHLGFVTETIPYPCHLPDMIDEVVGALVLGKIRNLNLKPFAEGTVTHFNDWMAGNDVQWSDFLHVGNSNMKECFELLGLHSEARKMSRLRAKLLKANESV